MLTIKNIDELTRKVNIKMLCQVAGIRYNTLQVKLYRFRNNESYAELTEEQAGKLTQAIDKLSCQLSTTHAM